jgi:glycosyltransferase involved in cell wall biosynthesis
VKILIVTDVPCWHPLRGSSRRITSLIDHLMASHSLTICLVNEMPICEWTTASRLMPIPVCGPGQPGRVALLLDRLASLAGLRRPGSNHDVREKNVASDERRNEPARLPDFQSETVGDYVSSLVCRGGFDIVLIEYISHAWLADRIRQESLSARIAVDTHDVMHLRNAESTKLAIPYWLEINEQEEREALSGCDAIVAISPEDKLVFQSMLPEKKVLLATWSADFGDHQDTATGPESKTVSIGFIGSDGHANRLGLDWFLDHCWPIIHRECPDNVFLEIAGPFSGNRQRQVHGIRWLGQISDVASFYQNIQIAINPALLKSGFKIKSLEALSRGVPLVSTTAGLAGLTETIGKGSFVADAPEEFARHVIALVRNPAARAKASSDATAIARGKFSPAAVYRELDSWIRGER